MGAIGVGLSHINQVLDFDPGSQLLVFDRTVLRHLLDYGVDVGEVESDEVGELVKDGFSDLRSDFLVLLELGHVDLVEDCQFD